MLGLGDGIAIAAVGAIIIAGILKMPTKSSKYMTKELCKAEQKNICSELKTIKEDISALFKQMRELNIYLREKK